jgi:Secretion system C-terminal sorting domain
MLINLRTKIVFLLAMICVYCQGLSAQGFEKFYTQDNTTSIGRVLTKCQDGGYLLAGDNTLNTNIYPTEVRLIKVNHHGEILWENNLITFSGSVTRVSDVIANTDGTYLVAGFTQGSNIVFLANVNDNGAVLWLKQYNNDVSSSIYDGFRIKIQRHNDQSISMIWNNVEGKIQALHTNTEGNEIWKNLYPQSDYAQNDQFSVKINADNSIYVSGKNGNLTSSILTTIIGFDGNYIGSFVINTSAESFTNSLIPYWLSDGNLLVTSNLSPDPFAVTNNYHLEKLSENGTLIWESTLANPPNTGYKSGGSLVETANGDFLLSYSYILDVSPSFNGNTAITKINANGIKQWTKVHIPTAEIAADFASYSVVPTDDGGFAALGTRFADFTNLPFITSSLYFIKGDANGRIYTRTILGRIMKDIDLNCADIPQETGFKNVPIVATNDQNKHIYATTDENGYYTMDVDSGQYIVSVVPPSEQWNLCQNDVIAIVTTVNDSANIDFPIQPNSTCPQMEVFISTDRVRGCVFGSWTINYCNLGTETAENAYVIVQLDPLMNPTSSSVPLTVLANNAVRLELGNVSSLDCGSVILGTFLSCDAILGQTLCAEAHVYPDTICGQVGAPKLTIKGKCVNNQIIFTIKNTGNAPMTLPVDYIVIEDDMIQLNFQGQIPTLGIGEEANISIPATGATFRMEINEGNGLIASAAIEACGNNPSFGFVTMFPPDDAPTFIDIFCKEVIGSYDPNEKLAYPKGATSEHYLAKNTDIEYQIDFQNTGTDTAYLVVLRDTLDVALNPASIRMGASSHPYTWELLDQGELKITFKDIYLVDSNANEPASHGFVQFRIAQQKDLVDGTVITNRAGIYFDGNLPVITNEVFHTIGKPYVLVTFDEEKALAKATVTPNPSADFAEITLNNGLIGAKNFILTDVTGRIIQSRTFEGDKISVNVKTLPLGLYYFQIIAENGFKVGGKMLKE